MTTNRPIHPGGPQLRCPGVAAVPGAGVGFIHTDDCCDRHELDARRADLRLGAIVEGSVAVRAIQAFAEPAR